MELVYQALDKNGRKIQARIEASGIKDARENLRRQGLFVTGIGPASSGNRFAGSSSGRSKLASVLGAITGSSPAARTDSKTTVRSKESAPRLPLPALLMFTRQLQMLLASGSAVVPALEAIRRQLRKPTHTEILSAIIRDLEGGQPLNQALRRHQATFDAAYISVIAAGEASADLPKAMARLAKTLGRRKAIRNKVLGSTAYPALLILMSMGIMIVMLFFVIPRFGEMMTGLGVPLPTPTRMLLSTAGLLESYWPVCLGLAATAIGGIVAMVRTAAGRQWLTNIQTDIPVLGKLTGQFIQANFLRTMGALLESGVGLLESLDLARGVTGNRRFVRMFQAVEHNIAAGQSMADAIEASKLVTPSVCQAIRTGEETGSVGPAMTFSADLLDEENTTLVDTVTKLVEPLILIGMGVIIGFVAISLFLPMFDLTAAVRG